MPHLERTVSAVRARSTSSQDYTPMDERRATLSHLDNMTSPRRTRPNWIYEYKGYKPPLEGLAVSPSEKMEQIGR